MTRLDRARARRRGNLAPVTGEQDEAAVGFARFTGTWTGTNGFRLMPDDDLFEAAARADVTTAAAGHDLVVRYTGVHPVDGAQDGVLLVGSPDDEGHVVAAWGDSWHQQPAIMVLEGTGTARGFEVAADYGSGWLWMITLDGGSDDGFTLTMHNVVPVDGATVAASAGPYAAMVAELHHERVV